MELMGNVVAGIVQILPLIAVPFILKGIIDGVPVLGNALQRGFSRSSGYLSNKADKSGWAQARRAEIKSGQRNAFGFNRSEAAQKNGRTAVQAWEDRGRRYGRRVKAAELTGDNKYDSRVRDEARRLEEFQPSDRKLQRGMENIAWAGARARVKTQESLEDQEAVSTANKAGLQSDADKRAMADPTSVIGQARRETLKSGYQTSAVASGLKEEVERQAFNNPTSATGQAIRQRQRTDALNAETTAGFGSVLDSEKRDAKSPVGQSERRRLAFTDQSATDTKALNDSFEQARADSSSVHAQDMRAAGVNTTRLRQNAIEQQARDQSLALSKGVQRQNYGNALDPDARTYDQSILDIAGGTVTPTGKIQAQAFGVQAIQKATKDQVDAARVLGGNNAEAAYTGGIRFNAASGNLEYHQNVYDSAGRVAGTRVITDEQGVLAGLKAAKVVAPDASSTAEFTAAGRKSLSYIQGFGNTTFGAEAIAANLATTAQLDGDALETIFRNITFEPGVSAADQNFEKSELVTRINDEARKAGFDFLSKNTIDASGNFVLGGMKGGIGGIELKRDQETGRVIFDSDGMAQLKYTGITGQVIDEKGIGGYTKYLMGDETTQGEAALAAYAKMMKSPGTFDAGLPQLTDKVKSQFVEQVDKIMKGEGPKYAGLRQTLLDAGMALPESIGLFRQQLDDRQKSAVLRKDNTAAPGSDMTSKGETATGQKPAEGADADGDDTTDNARDSGDIV